MTRVCIFQPEPPRGRACPRLDIIFQTQDEATEDGKIAFGGNGLADQNKTEVADLFFVIDCIRLLLGFDSSLFHHFLDDLAQVYIDPLLNLETQTQLHFEAKVCAVILHLVFLCDGGHDRSRNQYTSARFGRLSKME